MVVHDEVVADVGAEVFDKEEASAAVGADGGGVVFVDTEAEDGATAGTGLGFDPVEGEVADASPMVFGEDVEFAEEEDVALGLGFKTDVADGGAVGLNEGVGDAAAGHFPLHGAGFVPDGEHVVDLGVADDAGVVGFPDVMGKVDDGGDFVRADGAESDVGGGVRHRRWGEVVARPFQRVLPGGKVIGGGKSAEVVKNLVKGGFDDVFLADLFGVAGEFGFGEEGFGEVPAGPGAPSAEVFVGLDHAGGEVLPVAAWIADELGVLAVEDDPGEGLVGEGPVAQDGFIAREWDGEGAVALEDGLGGEFVLPEALGVVEAGEVEVGSAIGFGEAVDIGGGVRAVDGGEEGARRVHEKRRKRGWIDTQEGKLWNGERQAKRGRIWAGRGAFGF